MTLRGNASHEEPSSLRPAYIQAKGERTWNARFSSGKSVEVRASRTRNYPGLAGQAPRTQPFYQALLELSSGLRVLDVGSGAGEGCLALREHFATLRGIDSDATAVAFAREYVPGVEFCVADCEQSLPAGEADLVLLVDVLAHLQSPERALLNVRERLGAGGRVWIAEPRSAPGQRLRAPQRRGYNRRELTALLTRCGFRVEQWVCDDETFVAVLAQVDASLASETLVRAVRKGAFETLGGSHTELATCLESQDSSVVHEAQLLLAELLVERRQGEAAGELLVQARDAEPHDPRVWVRLGQLALQARDVQTAIQCAVEGLEREPCDPAAARLLAEAVQAVAHPQTLQAWVTASRSAPADLEVATRLARFCASEGDYHTGIVALERARDYQAVDANFHVVLGWLMLLDERPREALQHARAAWALAAGSSAALELRHALQEAGIERRIEA